MRCIYLTQLVVSFFISGVFVGTTPALCLAECNEPTIRIESREVVIPVHVVEITKTSKMETDVYGKEHWVEMVHTQEVTGLSTGSFHVFESGAEQKIQHFSIEKFHYWLAQDNMGKHAEYSCTPKGIWGGPDMQGMAFYGSKARIYLLTYVPQPSPEGSCHRIEVKVDHKHAMIHAPEQYCNTKDPLSDPLNGATLGKKMLAFANSEKTGKLLLGIQAVPFLGSPDAYRVDVSVEIPAKFLQREWDGIKLRTSIAILGLVYDKSNLLVSRFSDAACVPSEDLGYQGPSGGTAGPASTISDGQKYFEEAVIPATYQTQIELGPGDYRLELVITDGEKFGRATASIKLDGVDKDRLTTSGVALCRRYRKASSEPRSPSQAPQYVPLVSDGTEFTPAGDARFHKGEPIISYLEIYGKQVEDPAATMSEEVRVTDARTAEIKLDSGLLPLKFSTPSKNGTAAVVRNVSIDALPPGSYHLEAQVSDSQGHKTAWSSALFTVLN